jgi:endonuclease/exonuclease/phosphatase family metal-dependent hydrolase
MTSARTDLWPMVLATYNIHGAVGRDGRRDGQRVAEVVAEIGADVLALQEVPLGGAGLPNVAQLLREATGFEAAEGPTFDRAGARFGNTVLSRYPIAAVRNIDLSFGRREPRAALDADIDCHGQPLRIVATHLGRTGGERREQIRKLLQAFDTDRMPVVLAGDINEWMLWGRTLRWLTSHFQKVPARATFPSWRPVLALDRIWIRPRQRLVQVGVHASRRARIASDHLPLVAHIGAAGAS